MTGYAVVIRPPSALVDPDGLRALLPALQRRGPHGASVVHEGASPKEAVKELFSRALKPE